MKEELSRQMIESLCVKKMKQMNETRSQRKRPPVAVFETTSISDLAFLLLIFFIVISSFIVHKGLQLDLPDPEAATVEVKLSQNILINVLDNGFAIGNKVYDKTQLIQLLSQKKSNTPDLIAFLKIEDKVDYFRLIEALDILKQIGIQQIGLEKLK